mgnify:CR=1 FL=1
MLWALLITAAVVVVTGLALKFSVPWFRPDTYWSITWREFFAGVIAAGLVVIPSVFAVGTALSTADALTYEEFYNGVETDATVAEVECRAGTEGQSIASGYSNCSHSYNTGKSYTFTETYTVEVSDGCDSNGKNCKSHFEQRTRLVTAYIYNPYATKEYTYAITDSLGGSYRFPETYVKDGEGYGGKAIPSTIPRGDPAEWTNARKRLDEGNPRPVTRLFRYDNYILASQDDLLKPFSENVERYLDEGILPDHTANIKSQPLYGFNDSYADKVSFVGVEVKDEQAWQESLMSFNAALGSQLRGDLHLVLIDASLVDSATDYVNALKAYWLGEDFGRRAIAKNAIVVVVGVQGTTVEWGMASTGMPFGNEVMLQGIENFMPDTPLEPSQVIGSPRTVVTPASNEQDEDELRVTLGETPGVLERIVLQDFPFQRACMECSDDEGEIGYANLVDKIEPKPWQWAIMISIVGVLALAWWFCAGLFDLFNWLPIPSSSRRSFDTTDEDFPSSYFSQSSKKRLRDKRKSFRNFS